MSIYHKLLNPPAIVHGRRPESLTRKSSVATTTGSIAGPSVNFASGSGNPPASPGGMARRTSYNPGYTPLIETVNQAVRSTGLQPPAQVNADEFTRAVAVATVSALRHQTSPMRMRNSGGAENVEAAHGGHDAPSWSRGTSATVLLACTALYAVIAGPSGGFSTPAATEVYDLQRSLWTLWMLFLPGPVSTRSSSGSRSLHLCPTPPSS